MIGAGYVGLVSGACFSDFGHHVVCIDSNAEKVDSLNNGEMPIHEPGLAELVARNVGQGRLSFASDLKIAVSEAEVVFIAVGTPSRRGDGHADLSDGHADLSDGHADLSYVYAAAREIAGVLPERAVVVTKSTVPVGTGDEVERIIREENPAATVTVVSNPVKPHFEALIETPCLPHDQVRARTRADADRQEHHARSPQGRRPHYA
jgi:UDPglucose 6-dehydrogenase